MTVLQLLASLPTAQLQRLGAAIDPLGARRRVAAPPASFDNRPTWDNWSRWSRR